MEMTVGEMRKLLLTEIAILPDDARPLNDFIYTRVIETGTPIAADTGCQRHETWDIRRKQNRVGGIQYVFQCGYCGCSQPISKELKGWALDVCAGDADDQLYDTYWQQQTAARNVEYQEQRDERNSEWWARYDIYLASPEWRARSNKVLRRANGICEACDERVATQAHHLTYKHVCDEPLFDLVAVCVDCHDAITKADRERRARQTV